LFITAFAAAALAADPPGAAAASVQPPQSVPAGTATPAEPALQPETQAPPADAAPADAAPVAPRPPCCTLTALTPVDLEILTEASSKTTAIGAKIELRVVQAVAVDGRVVIPAGTQGFAEVIQASKARIGGKAGELSMGLPYLMLNGQRIGLKRFAYGPASGADRSTQVIVATALVGIAGMFISGGNIDVHSGARANAVVTTDTFVPVQP
jgi:hypothetical protein